MILIIFRGEHEFEECMLSTHHQILLGWLNK
jgi:hypothetical protein